MTPEEMRARIDEIKGKLKEMTVQAGTEEFDADEEETWRALNKEHDGLVRRLKQYHERVERVRAVLEDDVEVLREHDDDERPRRAAPRVPTQVYELEEYRRSANGSQDTLRNLMREGARKIVDEAVYAHPHARKSDVVEHVERLLERDRDSGELSQRIITTGSATYRRAFTKAWMGVALSDEENRALSLTTTAGGFAVPYTLDPTIIPTSNGSVNPFRQIARVETITGNEWRGVASAGVTAAYAAEAAEASDDAPTVSQPQANVERAQVFIPFSIEIGQDWGSLESEMARLVQDAKDDLEADKFVTGLGHGSNQPEGLLVGATAVLITSATAVMAGSDLYGLETALPPRFRPRASIVGNRANFNRVRQLDTQGGAALWMTIGEGLPNLQTGALGQALLGYPTYEASAYNSTTATGASILTIGDFSHFLIVDRAGMNVELLPHLLGSNRRPTGQRGLYFWWRNTSDVLAWQAFRTLKAL